LTLYNLVRRRAKKRAQGGLTGGKNVWGARKLVTQEQIDVPSINCRGHATDFLRKKAEEKPHAKSAAGIEWARGGDI